jgi:AcrR family transcriptional regulator
MPVSYKRTRLSPDARRNQLLDTAKFMIVAQGLQGFTMEALAREANVSSPLVYNYFSSRLSLLRDLLKREYSAYAEKISNEIGGSKSFEEIVRVYVTANFDHHAPGNILPLLLNQPDLKSAVRDWEKKDSRETARFLVSNMAKRYSLSKSDAEQLVSMASGASIAAAGYCAQSNADRDKAISTTMQFIFAGISTLSKKK